MRVLITSSRMPHALDEIRKFGREGHEVVACDTFETAPGSHSKYVHERIITPSPTYESARFVEQLDAIVKSRRIDLVLPAFEEVFRIAKHIDRFAWKTNVFAAPFDTLALLHDKARFASLCERLGVRVPATRTATSIEALREAIGAFDEYFARPAFSRGGVDMLTNVGPRAGEVSVEACDVSAERPWIVQRFVHGEDVCTFSVAHHGRIVAHSTYVHPIMIEHAGGISFESVDEPEALAISQRIVAALEYHGQISFDFIRSPEGLSIVECNPRPAAGVYLMDDARLVDAIIAPPSGPPHVVPPGRHMMIASAIVRDMFRDWHAIPADLRALFSDAGDVYAQRDDWAPGIYQVLSYGHVLAYRRRLHLEEHKHSDLVAAQFFDIVWDGGEIP